MAGRRPPVAARDRDSGRGRGRGRGSKADDDAVALDRVLAAKEIVICCGSGGVGKTTTAAALAAMAAAHLGGKVLVITVDPARRLATALGLEQFGNVETRVPHELFVEAGTEPRGELWGPCSTPSSRGTTWCGPTPPMPPPATPSWPTRCT